MPGIYLSLERQQVGPYEPEQLRQQLADGKVTLDTLAWHEGLSQWSSLSAVLANFPAEGHGSSAVLPPIPVPQKKKMSGCWMAAIILGVMGFVGFLGLIFLAVVSVGPIQNGLEKAKENMAMQQARAIALAMYQYSIDHNGAYPEGKTSTEVFQKLLDEKYISDPAFFYVSMPGKIKATSNTLTSENVCYDVTSGVTPDTSGQLPLVFITGYTMQYTAGGSASREADIKSLPGIAMAYKSNRAIFLKAGPDGTVPNVIAADFDSGSKTYTQLKP